MANYDKVRIKILKALYDIENGKNTDFEVSDRLLGVSGIDLFNNIEGHDLTSHEFTTQLVYLEKKKTILGKPEKRIPTQEKSEQLELVWYTITDHGIDVVEGKRKSSNLSKQIIQIIAILGSIASIIGLVYIFL